MNKILISVSSFGELDKRPLDMLKEAGLEVVTNPHSRRLNPEELINLGKGCIGIIAGLEHINKEVLSKLSTLKVISRVGIGTDNIDLETAQKQNVVVRNTPDAPTQAVAELTLGLMFDLLRKISLMNKRLKSGEWKRLGGNLLNGKTVGIIGLGRIGKRVAELLKSFNVSIIAHDIVRDEKWLNLNKVRMSTLEELIKTSDIITLHISGTKQVIGYKQIKIMKKGAYIINLARGGIVDEEALHKSLLDGHISGAALDVFCQEPYNGPLKKLDSVILTPHAGSDAKEVRVDMEMQAASNLISEIRK